MEKTCRARRRQGLRIIAIRWTSIALVLGVITRRKGATTASELERFENQIGFNRRSVLRLAVFLALFAIRAMARSRRLNDFMRGGG